MKQLTERQKEVLQWIKQHTKPRYPTMQAVANHFGFRKQTAHYYIQRLKDKGYLQ